MIVYPPPPMQPPAEHRTIEFKEDIIAKAGIDLDVLLNCLEMVENGKPSDPGGVLCWTKKAWVEDAGKFIPYNLTANNETSRLFARARLRRLAGMLCRTQNISPYNLALLWNKGFVGTLRVLDSYGALKNDYGIRVSNLYYDTKSKA
jgi:hypothetical protein